MAKQPKQVYLRDTRNGFRAGPMSPGEADRLCAGHPGVYEPEGNYKPRKVDLGVGEEVEPTASNKQNPVKSEDLESAVKE